MNVFILSTGRSGTTTFIKACSHINNYTAEHESRSHLIGKDHFAYPENHIEADNRLSWFLGWIDEIFGNNAFYVHLKRDKQKVAESFVKRLSWDVSIAQAYKKHLLAGSNYKKKDNLKVCIDLCDTVEKNIDLFLKDKTKKMIFNIEDCQQDFNEFWIKIGAEGDINAALDEWENIMHQGEDLISCSIL